MKYYKTNIQYHSPRLILFLVSLFLGISVSCGDDKMGSGTGLQAGDEISFDVTFGIRGADAKLDNGDSEFESIALFVFDKQSGDCVFETFTPSFPAPATKKDTCHIPVKVTVGSKILYAIANYNTTDGVLDPVLINNPTMDYLDDIIVNSTDLSEGSHIPMAGKKEIIVDANLDEVEFALTRLACRVDLHVFKSEELKDEVVKLVNVKFNNPVYNSYCFTEDMPATTDYKSSVTKTVTDALTLYNASWEATPANRTATFYSYQSLFTPDQNGDPTPADKLPELEITITIDGILYTYKAKIIDTADKSYYDLHRNTIYQIEALIKPKGDITLRLKASPWDTESSAIGYNPQQEDYTFDFVSGHTSEALQGEVQWPRPSQASGATPGDIENKTSFAHYSFELTAPDGAVWTAQLTNGLEFAFDSEGSVAGKNAVSKGIARKGAYEIKVGAAKPWGGAERETELYITVDGQELIINPEISAGVRKFEGTDTRILIKQTEYR